MKKLAGLRVTAELKQKDVANIFGVTQGTVSFWENGVSKPSFDKIPLLAELYGVTEQEIVTACINSPTNMIHQEKIVKNDKLKQIVF